MADDRKKKKKRIAILGGGMAGLTAAYELSRTEELRQRYEVSVYQMGWRLGGKGASGRDPKTKRIEEHGLHIWFGFYDNAFNMIKEVYKSAARRPGQPLATWQDAFKGAGAITLLEQLDGESHTTPWEATWSPLDFSLPPRGEEPGGYTGGRPSLWAEMQQLVNTAMDNWGPWENKLVAAGYDSSTVDSRKPKQPAGPKTLLRRTILESQRLAMGTANRAEHLVTGELHEGSGWGSRLGERIFSPLSIVLRQLERDLVRTLQDLDKLAWEHYARHHLEDDGFRQFCAMVNVGAALATGLVNGEVDQSTGFAGGDKNFDDWLQENGARSFTLQESGIVRAVYDMAFGLKGSYPPQAMSRRDLDADTAILDLLRLFCTYHGDFYYKMQAGMGDTVFAPLYSVLKNRGVRFNFFHRVTKLSLDKSRSSVSGITIVPQMETEDGKDYDPIIEVKGLQCWPSQPKWELLEEPSTIRSADAETRDQERSRYAKKLESGEGAETDGPGQVLRQGEDFDTVVLAIPIAALAPICQELMEDERNTPFRDMVVNGHTVMTQAFQLWLTQSPTDLGWLHGKGSIVTSFLEPMDTYCDMGQLIEREGWSAENNVQGLAYFCGILPDSRKGGKITNQQDADTAVIENAQEMLERYCRVYWPGAYSQETPDHRFAWETLVDPDERKGPDRLTAQYFRANFAPTERYTQTPPGSLQYRLWPEESGYENLFLAGDWTRTPLNAGCIEAAVMSGMRCAHGVAPESTRPISGSHPDWLVPSSKANGSRRSSSPSYVPYGGLTSVPGPFQCANGVMYAFWVKADQHLLAELCRDVFVAPPNDRLTYGPLSDHVMVTFGSMDVRSTNEAQDPLFNVSYDQMGSSPERNAALWVLVGSREDAAVFSPAMWVDNPISLAGGREIYGFAKNWGKIEFDEAETSFSVDAYGGDFGPGNVTGLHRLLTLTAGDPVDPFDVPLDSGRVALEVVSEHLRQFGLNISDERFLLHILEELARRQLRQLFLRQFRTPGNGLRASPREFVAAKSTFQTMRVGVLHHGYDLEVRAIDSHPLERELGIGGQEVDFGLKISGEFTLDQGTPL